MATNNTLFHIDAIVVDGAPIAFEDGSGKIEGAARFENETVTSATGDDFQKRKRIASTFTTKIQFGPAVDPGTFSAMSEVQITARDTVTGRRALMPKCSFGKLGAIGEGTVDVTWNLLAPIQWI